jgi:hypothetical protein
MWRILCLIIGHHWGPLEGDNWSGFHTCQRCGKTKRFPTAQPPETRDHLGINH